MSKFKEFLKELGTNAELMESYKQDPHKTMKKSGLNSKEIEAIHNVDMAKIKSLLGDESDYYTIVIHKHEHGM